jgi:hypothetical protein
VVALRSRLPAGGAAASASPQPTVGGPGSPCLGQAATDAKVAPQSVPELQATLTYRGSPAQVFVFEVAGSHRAEVLGVPGCGLLTAATF